MTANDKEEIKQKFLFHPSLSGNSSENKNKDIESFSIFHSINRFCYDAFFL